MLRFQHCQPLPLRPDVLKLCNNFSLHHVFFPFSKFQLASADSSSLPNFVYFLLLFSVFCESSQFLIIKRCFLIFACIISSFWLWVYHLFSQLPTMWITGYRVCLFALCTTSVFVSLLGSEFISICPLSGYSMPGDLPCLFKTMSKALTVWLHLRWVGLQCDRCVELLCARCRSTRGCPTGDGDSAQGTGGVRAGTLGLLSAFLRGNGGVAGNCFTWSTDARCTPFLKSRPPCSLHRSHRLACGVFLFAYSGKPSPFWL